MCRLLAVLVVTGMVLFLSTLAFAAPQTITGRLIDETCYKANKANAGLDHKMPEDTPGCAVTCAKMGLPVALLTDDGKVYKIADQDKVVSHAGQKVTINGTLKGDTLSVKKVS